MRLRKFVPIYALAAGLSASAFAATWGAYNPTTRKITATEGGRSVTVTMPAPNTSAGGTYIGTSGDYYRYSKGGSIYRLKLEPSGSSLFVTIESEAAISPWSVVYSP
ncbi:MAG: hypothetical protein AAGM22_33230, partial [Acidobacteriota bacterium]